MQLSTLFCVCTKKPRLNSVSACLSVARSMRVRLVLAVQGRVNTDNMSASWLFYGTRMLGEWVL